MLSFQDFRFRLNQEIDLRCEQGEAESFPIQDEEKDEESGCYVITWDYFAEEYAKYLKFFGIYNTSLGILNSDKELKIIPIKNGKVIYSRKSLFHDLGLDHEITDK